MIKVPMPVILRTALNSSLVGFLVTNSTRLHSVRNALSFAQRSLNAMLECEKKRFIKLFVADFSKGLLSA